MAISEETFFLNARFEGTLQSQIQQVVAEGILSGRFRPGEKLPSSRKLAKHLGVSRITVTMAYTELLASDFLRSAGRSGYFVSETAPIVPTLPTAEKNGESFDWDAVLSDTARPDLTHRRPADWRDYRFPFIYGQADATLFDYKTWRLSALQALGAREFAALADDQGNRDDPRLVEFITRHILPRRGIAARPEEVLITLGAQNGLWLASQVVLGNGRSAAIETPSYPALRDILVQNGCPVFEVPVDADGLNPDDLPDADVAFVTPSHQCPTNATMPVERRRALLEAAREKDMLLIEDDYEFEMSFLSPPHPALKSLDTDGRVVYAGSFSKSLFPGLRLGFLVGSERFIREARALRWAVLRHPAGHVQRTTALFLAHGHYDAHIRRMQTALEERRKVMAAALDAHGLEVVGKGVFGGSSFWMSAPDTIDTTELSEALKPEGVLIEPGRAFFGAEGPKHYYRLAYSSIPASRIAEGVARIAKSIQNFN